MHPTIDHQHFTFDGFLDIARFHVNRDAIDELLTKESADTLTNPMEGVFINGITIYVKTGDIRKPVEGEVLMIDGRMHLVKRVSDEMGLLTIVAESNEQ